MRVMVRATCRPCSAGKTPKTADQGVVCCSGNSCDVGIEFLCRGCTIVRRGARAVAADHAPRGEAGASCDVES